MRAAPAFELTLGLSATERELLALLGAVVAAALAAWVWSHIDAAAGPAGRGARPWLTVVPIAASVGAWIACRAGRAQPCRLCWHHGSWTWSQGGLQHEGAVEPRLDLGSWLLLALRPQRGAVRWATVSRISAGAAWHPLRAELFAPDRATIEPGAGEGVPR